MVVYVVYFDGEDYDTSPKDRLLACYSNRESAEKRLKDIRFQITHSDELYDAYNLQVVNVAVDWVNAHGLFDKHFTIEEMVKFHHEVHRLMWLKELKDRHIESTYPSSTKDAVKVVAEAFEITPPVFPPDFKDVSPPGVVNDYSIVELEIAD